MAFAPTPKNPGDLIKSSDWNDALSEIARLNTAKLDLAGGEITGPLTVDGALGVGTKAPDRALTAEGPGGTYINVKANNGAFEVLLGADSASGGIVSTMTNHDLQLRSGANVTHMILKANGSVGIGTNTPGFRFDVADRMRVRQGPNGTAGIWFFQSAPNIDRAFVGMATDTSVGFWGNSGVGWGLQMDTTDGGVTFNSRFGQRIKVGVPKNPPYLGDGIRGEPNLWLDAAGQVILKNGWGTNAMDIAERFPTTGLVEAGQVVIFDELLQAVRLCDREADRRVVGIASTEPAGILGMNNEEVPIALLGRVPCFVDADIAPITAGDLLTTSPTKGYAQRVMEPATATGAILGKAMGSLPSGKGKITVLVVLQ